MEGGESESMKIYHLSWEPQLPGEVQAKDEGEKHVKKGFIGEYEHCLVVHGKTGSF